MFFSPGFVIRLGVPVETVWEGVKAGLADAHHDLDINCRMILDFDKPAGPGPAAEMVGVRRREQDRDLLVGMGADSIERGIDHRAFAAAFTEAAALRAAPHDPRRRGRSGRQHRHRRSTSSAASASTTASACSTIPTSPPRSPTRQIPLDGVPDQQRGDRQRRRRRRRPPVRPPARGRRAGDAELRRSGDDGHDHLRRLRGRHRSLSATTPTPSRTSPSTPSTPAGRPPTSRPPCGTASSAEMAALRERHGLAPRFT